MHFSIELQILIESIKIVLLEKSSKKLLNLLENERIDWKRLEKLATFHAIRPVVFEALRILEFQNVPKEITLLYTNAIKEKALLNLIMQDEYNQLKKIFEEENIEFIAYKGIFWQNSSIKNYQREAGDIDILIRESDFEKAIQLLIKKGYYEKVTGENTTLDEILKLKEKLIERGDMELVFLKKNSNSKSIELDLHWGITNTYSTFQFELENLFKIEHKEAQLWLMLFHNGNREAWHRLKYVCDYIVMLQKYQPNWELVCSDAEKYKILNTLKTIIFIVENVFGMNIFFQDSLKSKTITSITKVWEYGFRYELNVKARLLYENAKMNQFDPSSSKWKYLYGIFKYQSYPDLREKDRFITFSKNYPILNFISKFITFLIKKSF